MHLYQAGMPLALLTEWLGHSDPETTLMYAHADTEMKRQALDKANIAATSNPLPTPLWHGREDIIQRLCGLKNRHRIIPTSSRRQSASAKVTDISTRTKEQSSE